MEQETDKLVAVVLGLVMLIPYTVAVTFVCVAIFGGAGLLAAPVFYLANAYYLLK